MLRKPEFYLSTIEEMCDYLLDRAQTRSQTDYLSDMELRLAVERAFILIGEAMSLLRKHFPDISAELDGHVAAIGFRNLLVHRYWDIDNRDVWSIVMTEIHPLKNKVDRLLRQAPPSA